MKFILLIALVACFLGCKESTEEYDNLSEADRAWIRDRSAIKCRAEFASVYANYVLESNKAYTSTSFEREDGYYHELLEGTAVKYTVDIKVWKQTADDLYLYITKKITEPGESYFLRINKSVNASMIASLAEDHCTKEYTSVSISTNGPMSISKNWDAASGANRNYYEDTYTLDFTRPAFLGPYKLTRKITTKDANGTVVGSVISYTSTYVYKAYTFTAGIPYSNSAYYTQKFYEPDFTTGSFYRIQENSQDFKMMEVLPVDATTPPVGWDLSI